LEVRYGLKVKKATDLVFISLFQGVYSQVKMVEDTWN